jgi:hypothetical protein
VFYSCFVFIDLRLYVNLWYFLKSNSYRGSGELRFDIKSFEVGVVLKLRHGGAPPATVPENYCSIGEEEGDLSRFSV